MPALDDVLWTAKAPDSDAMTVTVRVSGLEIAANLHPANLKHLIDERCLRASQLLFATITGRGV